MRLTGRPSTKLLIYPTHVHQDALPSLANVKFFQPQHRLHLAPRDGPALRPGEEQRKPSAVPMASFAYSSGVKSMEVGQMSSGSTGW